MTRAMIFPALLGGFALLSLLGAWRATRKPEVEAGRLMQRSPDSARSLLQVGVWVSSSPAVAVMFVVFAVILVIDEHLEWLAFALAALVMLAASWAHLAVVPKVEAELDALEAPALTDQQQESIHRWRLCSLILAGFLGVSWIVSYYAG